MDENKPPILSQRYAIIGTRIVVIFSAVFIFMKLFAIISQGLWVIPNLLICLPALLLAILGISLLKSNKSHIGFVIFAVVIFVLVRINEEYLQLYFYEFLNA